VASWIAASASSRRPSSPSRTDAGCERIWADVASGRLARRPGWDACLDHLRVGDELVVTRLSRMARSVRHLTGIAALLAERGIDLVVLKQGIDTATVAGQFTFHVLAFEVSEDHQRRLKQLESMYRVKTELHLLDLNDFTPGAICMVLTSDVYAESDYIRDRNTFLELTKANRS